MGCSKESCGITNLPISEGDEIYTLIVHKNIKHAAHAKWELFTIPIAGSYNDYGQIENINVSEAQVEFLRSQLKDSKLTQFYKETDGGTYTDSYIPDCENKEAYVMDFLESIRNTTIKIELPCWYRFNRGKTEEFILDRMMVHKFAYDELVEHVDPDFGFRERPTIEEDLKRSRASFRELIDDAILKIAWWDPDFNYHELHDVSDIDSIWSWLCSISCTGPIGFVNTLPRYTKFLAIGDYTESSDDENKFHHVGNGRMEDIDELVDHMTTIVRFSVGMLRLRKALSSMGDGGSQLECYSSHISLAEKTRNFALAKVDLHV